MDYNHFLSNAPITRRVIEQSGSTIDWLQGHGAKFKLIDWNPQQGQNPYPIRWRIYHRYQDNHTAFVNMYKSLEKMGGKLLTSTRAYDLEQDKDGNVTAVIAEKADGGKLTIKTKALVLATGGYGGDMKRLSEKMESKQLTNRIAWANNGEGIDMALKAGAQKMGENSALIHACEFDGLSTSTAGAHGMIDSNLLVRVLKTPLLWVDPAGHRFCNEELIYDTVYWANAGYSVGGKYFVVVDGKTVMSGSRMTIIAGVFSICAILCYIVCFKLTRERVEVPASSQKVSASAIFKSIFTNRALLGIIVAAIFVLLSQLTVMSLAGYVYPNVYGSAAAQSTASLLGTVVMLIVCAPFASKLAAKFGKKELAVASSICSALVWLVCLIWRPASVWGFVACYILANVGMGFFNTIIWAMITDVIDDAEVRSGIREDGTIYSVYSFARKLGQAFSSGLVGALLGIIGYTEATAFDPAVTRGIFNMACIAPIIGFVCIVLALVFLYPLNKKKVEENVAALAARRNSK